MRVVGPVVEDIPAGVEANVSETAQTLRILEDDEQSVLAGFPAGTDLQQFSVAGVSAGVVRNVQDEINLPTTVGLEGATSSLNSRPQLLEVTNLDTTLNRRRVRRRPPRSGSSARTPPA